MAGSRFNLIPRAHWIYLGPAYKGLSDDLDALETSVAEGGAGGEPTVTDLSAVYQQAKV